ncbi:GGDEF domain-containing protein [Nocardia sp. JMUB6875]|uniref:GGDEF domain-containing protein n=1 Tax=Nocardia sp. JMUB6875 TaxID=3158170 RepID=UPI0032E7B066
MGEHRALLRCWWQDRVDYRGLTATLESSSALSLMRFIVALGGAVLSAIAILTVLSPAGPVGGVGRLVVVAVGVLAAGWALRWWLLPWPSATESLIWLGTADVAITASCLLDSDRVYGSLGAMLLVVTGGYLSIFHGPKALAAHTVWSLLSILALTMRLDAGAPIGDAPLAVAIVLIMVAATVLVLPALQFCYWLLRIDTLTDPLTGLLNRRGLDYYLPGLTASVRGGEICVISVDLDRFKAVNDRFGHTVGDRALTHTAERLRNVRTGFLVARIGGEEFALVGHPPSEATCVVAEAVRQAIADIDDLPVHITASVGATVFDTTNTNGSCAVQLLAQALRSSDTAMYQAKHSGGNTVIVSNSGQTTALP